MTFTKRTVLIVYRRASHAVATRLFGDLERDFPGRIVLGSWDQPAESLVELLVDAYCTLLLVDRGWLEEAVQEGAADRAPMDKQASLGTAFETVARARLGAAATERPDFAKGEDEESSAVDGRVDKLVKQWVLHRSLTVRPVFLDDAGRPDKYGTHWEAFDGAWPTQLAEISWELIRDGRPLRRSNWAKDTDRLRRDLEAHHVPGPARRAFLAQQLSAWNQNSESPGTRPMIPMMVRRYDHHSGVGESTLKCADELDPWRLAVIGEAGAGKTTFLLQMTRRLLDRALEDEDAPVPWFLAAEALEHPGGREPYSVCHLMDDVDNKEPWSIPDVIALRDAASPWGPSRMMVELQPLSDDQVVAYLPRCGLTSDGELMVMRPGLREVRTSPLFLSMILRILEREGSLPWPAERIVRRDQVLDHWVDVHCQTAGRDAEGRSRARVLRTMRWLAWVLHRSGHTRFLPERLGFRSLRSPVAKSAFAVLMIGAPVIATASLLANAEPGGWRWIAPLGVFGITAGVAWTLDPPALDIRMKWSRDASLAGAVRGLRLGLGAVAWQPIVAVLLMVLLALSDDSIVGVGYLVTVAVCWHAVSAMKKEAAGRSLLIAAVVPFVAYPSDIDSVRVALLGVGRGALQLDAAAAWTSASALASPALLLAICALLTGTIGGAVVACTSFSIWGDERRPVAMARMVKNGVMFSLVVAGVYLLIAFVLLWLPGARPESALFHGLWAGVLGGLVFLSAGGLAAIRYVFVRLSLPLDRVPLGLNGVLQGAVSSGMLRHDGGGLAFHHSVLIEHLAGAKKRAELGVGQTAPP